MAIRALIESTRLPLVNEKVTQEAIENLFALHGLECKREHRLSDSDIPDFFFADTGLLIEVKLRAPRMGIFRQLERYAEHEAVKALMLVTATAMHLPVEIKGKPAMVVSLGRGWL